MLALSSMTRSVPSVGRDSLTWVKSSSSTFVLRQGS